LQPNQLGFQQLLQRAGGKSSGNPQVILQNALTITATTIPDYLKCGICGNVVQTAMLLPWDREGRTACESCIRPALAKNNFICPLTGTENVSPDELMPNFGLRKAAENFVKSVLDKMEEIELEALRITEGESAKDNLTKDNQTLFENAADHGTLESKKMKRNTTQSKTVDYLDDFGGDVFDVEADATEVDDNNAENEDGQPATLEQNSNDDNTNISSEMAKANISDDVAHLHKTPPTRDVHSARTVDADRALDANASVVVTTIPSEAKLSEPSVEAFSNISSAREKDESSPRGQSLVEGTASTDHQQMQRGPPAGYAIGPAAPTALNNPRMSHAAAPVSSTPSQSIPPPPPGLPPSAMQQYPQRGRGFQPYPQRGHFRGKGGRYGAFHRGGAFGGRFDGRGDSVYIGGRGDFRQQAQPPQLGQPGEGNSPVQGGTAQGDDLSAASSGKKDRSDSMLEKEEFSFTKSPKDGNKIKSFKRPRGDEDDASEAQSEHSGIRGRDGQRHANSNDLHQNPPPQHHVRGGRGGRRAYRPPGPGFPPERGDRGRWSHGHMPPRVAPAPYYPPPPPYGFHQGMFGPRGQGRDFRGTGRDFYSGGRF